MTLKIKILRPNRTIKINWNRNLQIEYQISLSANQNSHWTSHQAGTNTSDPIIFVNNINTLYGRLDMLDFSAKCKSLLETLPFHELDYESCLTQQDVYLQLIRCKPSKAHGLDGIQGRVLKNCALELTLILHSLIRSLCMATIQVTWKTSAIIPVPKKTHQSELNHYRPVALTSVIMKCFETGQAHHHQKRLHFKLQMIQSQKFTLFWGGAGSEINRGQWQKCPKISQRCT